MWNGWVDPETPATHIIGHWNYAPGTTKPVNVVSNGDAVELFLNGRSLGRGARSSGFLFTWPAVRWEPGVLRAVTTHVGGGTTTFQVETVGPATALRLTPHVSPRGFVMDGADIALVDVEVIDAKGRRVPTANDRVAFALTGPAEWRGGIAQGDSSGKPRSAVAVQAEVVPGTTPTAGTARAEDNYVLSRTLPVEAGVNRVLLRAGTAGGPVRLVATAPGLKPATLTLSTVAAAPLTGGLSRAFAEAAQPGLLTRGPTPAGTSYRVTRTTLLPNTILAGSGQADASKTIDDNELSRWASDGTPANAWIEYRFAQPVTLSEIELKLVGWRQRGYPLRITLDGREVWRGETERQLGYAAVAFAPAKGQVLRITQIAPTQDRDAFGKIVEVSNARQAGDTGADAVPAGWRLGIVEADFHGPVTDKR
jgi:beta-galactosidase